METLRDFCRAVGVPASALKRIFSDDDFNVARLTKHCEEWYSVFSLLGLCSRKSIKAFYTMDLLSELYSATTGFKIDGKCLKETAERVWNLMKLLNVREGFSREKDVFPESWMRPLKDGRDHLVLKDYYGRKELGSEDLYQLLNDYYEEHGWCIPHGIPTEKKVKELQLENEAKSLKMEFGKRSESCHVG